MPGTSRRSVKSKKIVCIQCKIEINEKEEDAIECDKCEKKFHVICTMLDKRQYDYLVKHNDEEFICHLCADNSGTIKNELCLIKTELKKLDQISVLQETMNFMSKQYDDILRGVEENRKKLETIQKENKTLKVEIKSLKSSIKYLNDERVKNDCMITGITTSTDTSAVDTVLELAKTTGVVIGPECIDDAYFVNNKRGVTNDKKSVVVKMNSKRAKSTMMSMKPKLREREETKNIYVQDFLSRESMNLLNYARTLKTVGYRSVYAAGGKVYIKRSELSKPKIIRSEDDVNKLLLEATTYRSTKRGAQNAEAVTLDSEESYLSS